MISNLKTPRLITCDMDGTLVFHERVELEQAFITELKRLIQKGIPFACASGRPYHSLHNIFGDLGDSIYYITENGAIVLGLGKDPDILSTVPIPRHDALELIRDVMHLSEIEICISGIHQTYIIPKDPSFSVYSSDQLRSKIVVVSDPEDIKEPIVKCSTFWRDKSQEMADLLFPKWKNRMAVAISGHNWTDFTVATKGNGLQMLCHHLGISPCDVLSFGDADNDISLLDSVGTAVIMNHASEHLLKRYPNHCYRVQEILKQL